MTNHPDAQPHAPASDAAPRWSDLLAGPYAAAAWTLCLGVGTHALNWFLVATAVPSIVLDLGGAAQVSWVSALYLVFSIVGSAAGGDLKKRLGGRTALAAAAVVLVAASILAAAAPSFGVFLIARSVQGLAEGLILALCYVLVAEVFPARAQPQVFSLLAVVWAVATIAGPIVAGVLTAAASWRVALWTLVPLAAGLVVLAVKVVPGGRDEAARPAGFPVLRLSLLLAGALAICVAGETAIALLGGGLIVTSVVLFVAGLALDRRAAHPLLPRGLLAPRDASPIGLWIIGLMMFAETGIAVFCAFIAQIGFSTSPLVAGQIASIPALTWSAAALAIARLSDHLADRAVLAGPLTISIGLAIVAAGVATMAMAPFLIGLALAGAGFGLSHGFLSQRIMAAAAHGETETTSGGIATFEGIGSAFGAAVAGVVAVRAGFDGSAASVPSLAIVFAGGTAVGLVAVALAVRFVALNRHARRAA